MRNSLNYEIEKSTEIKLLVGVHNVWKAANFLIYSAAVAPFRGGPSTKHLCFQMSYSSLCHLAVFLDCEMFVDHFDVALEIVPFCVIPVIIGFAP